MNELQIFKNNDFGEIRTLEEDGKILFCASDVAKSLGYAKPQNAITTHCKGALKRGIGVETGKKADGTTAIQNIEMLFIYEGDVYRLITHSKLPTAEKFEKWVFDEVLPLYPQARRIHDTRNFRGGDFKSRHDDTVMHRAERRAGQAQGAGSGKRGTCG